MKQYQNQEQPTFPTEDCGCEACIGERENQRLIAHMVFDQDKLDKLAHPLQGVEDLKHY